MSFVHGAEHAASAAMIGCRQPNHSFISISPTPCHAFSHSRTVLEPPLHVRQWETVRNTKSTTPRVPCCQSQASGSMHTLCTERGELLALVPVSGIQDNAVKVLSSPCSFILITHICTNFIHVQGIVPMPVTGYRIHIHIISVSVTRQQPHTSKPVRLFLTAMFPSIGRLFLLLLPACSLRLWPGRRKQVLRRDIRSLGPRRDARSGRERTIKRARRRPLLATHAPTAGRLAILCRCRSIVSRFGSVKTALFVARRARFHLNLAQKSCRPFSGCTAC